jgi:hypothetical protein
MAEGDEDCCGESGENRPAKLTLPLGVRFGEPGVEGASGGASTERELVPIAEIVILRTVTAEEKSQGAIRGFVSQM